MSKFISSTLFALLATLTLCGTAAVQAGEPQVKSTYSSVGAYYSPTLGAQFRVETLFLPAFGNFTAVRMVSLPDAGSPLNALGLQPGDVITRLDGIRTDNLAELENHYSLTQVRYIKTGTQNVLIGTINIVPAVAPAPMPGPVAPVGNAP
jgi:S1-C subfamily serine protease